MVNYTNEVILNKRIEIGLFDVVNTTMKSINNQYNFKVLVLTNEHIRIYGLLVLMIFVMTSTIAMIKISKLSPKNIFNLDF